MVRLETTGWRFGIRPPGVLATFPKGFPFDSLGVNAALVRVAVATDVAVFVIASILTTTVT